MKRLAGDSDYYKNLDKCALEIINVLKDDKNLVTFKKEFAPNGGGCWIDCYPNRDVLCNYFDQNSNFFLTIDDWTFVIGNKDKEITKIADSYNFTIDMQKMNGYFWICIA